MKRLISFTFICCLLSSCSTLSTVTRESQYSKMYEDMPLTLLVMPPINNSNDPEAKEFLYTSISRPLAEAGYYVIPPLLTADILKSENAYDSERFFDAPLTELNNLFGADAVVFSIIESWEKIGLGIQTKLRYVIKSAQSNEILFDRSCELYLDLAEFSRSNDLFGVLFDLATSAISTATTDNIIAAREANYYILRDIPRGKYNPDHMVDMEETAEKKDVFILIH